MSYWDLEDSPTEVYVDNCDWSDSDGIIGCEIEGYFMPGTDRLRDGTLVFQNGTVGNLVSYISPGKSMGTDPHDTLHNGQHIVNRMTSHSAPHQALRNYALK